MKIAFYSTKPYDRIWFEPLGKEYGFDIHFIEAACNQETVFMARGYDAICIFVNDHVNADMIEELYEMKVKAILLRSAGFNHVDVKAAENKITILRVPSYSPEAVAEFAMAMLLTINRMTHKAYNRTREFNMSLNGLMGTNLYEKTAGVVGTGKIGQAMIKILNGFQMRVLCYDPYPAKGVEAEYVSLNELLKQSDVISLHCPLTSETKYMINKDSIQNMKEGVYLVNTSRGGLINTDDLIDAMLLKKFGGVGLDVYEEEKKNVFEDRSDDIMESSVTARLLSFPNVMITSHQGFFTQEALEAISETTLNNAVAFEKGERTGNEVE